MERKALEKHRWNSKSEEWEPDKEGREEDIVDKGQEDLKAGYVLAPCSHDLHCPMPGGSWCHFSQRLVRGRLQRQIKKAKSGHEDEKFAYLVIAQGERPKVLQSGTLEDDAEEDTEMPWEEAASHWPRLLSEPIKRSGHVIMDVCAADGEIGRKVVSKSHGGEFGYKQARRMVQGDLWPFPFLEDEVGPKEPERYD